MYKVAREIKLGEILKVNWFIFLGLLEIFSPVLKCLSQGKDAFLNSLLSVGVANYSQLMQVLKFP